MHGIDDSKKGRDMDAQDFYGMNKEKPAPSTTPRGGRNTDSDNSNLLSVLTPRAVQQMFAPSLPVKYFTCVVVGEIIGSYACMRVAYLYMLLASEVGTERIGGTNDFEV